MVDGPVCQMPAPHHSSAEENIQLYLVWVKIPAPEYLSYPFSLKIHALLFLFPCFPGGIVHYRSWVYLGIRHCFYTGAAGELRNRCSKNLAILFYFHFVGWRFVAAVNHESVTSALQSRFPLDRATGWDALVERPSFYLVFRPSTSQRSPDSLP
jgi:hypothetical protein